MLRTRRVCLLCHACLVAAVVATVAGAAQESPGPLTVWYRQPAKAWVEACPIGNGRLGGMVFGEVANEHVQLNDDALWAGGPKDRCNPKALAALPEVRRLLFAGKNNEAANLAGNTMMGVPPTIESYQTLGDLRLTLPGLARRERGFATTAASSTWMRAWRRSRIGWAMRNSRGSIFPRPPTRCSSCD